MQIFCISTDGGAAHRPEVVRRVAPRANERKAGAMARNLAPVKEPALSVLCAEPGLSLAAKGLAVYLLTRPPRTVTFAELFRTSSDPMPLIYGAVRELEAAGIVARVAGRRGRSRDTAGIQLRVPVAS